MFGMGADYTFLLVISLFVGLIIAVTRISTHWSAAWQRRGIEREKTAQLAHKAAMKRAEADAKMVEGWQPPTTDR